MAANIEIKARCGDSDLIRARLNQLGVMTEGLDDQTDTFFDVPRGRLKLRESRLHGNYLIPYWRPDQHEAKQADYVLLPVTDVKACKELLSRMFGIKGVVKKQREVYLHQNVRIHLDEVQDLGSFIELEAVMQEENSLEANQQKIAEMIRLLDIRSADLIAGAYLDLLSGTDKG